MNNDKMTVRVNIKLCDIMIDHFYKSNWICIGRTEVTSRIAELTFEQATYKVANSTLKEKKLSVQNSSEEIPDSVIDEFLKK